MERLLVATRTVLLFKALQKRVHPVVPKLYGAIVQGCQNSRALCIKCNNFHAVAFRLELEGANNNNVQCLGFKLHTTNLPRRRERETKGMNEHTFMSTCILGELRTEKAVELSA